MENGYKNENLAQQREKANHTASDDDQEKLDRVSDLPLNSKGSSKNLGQANSDPQLIREAMTENETPQPSSPVLLKNSDKPGLIKFRSSGDGEMTLKSRKEEQTPKRRNSVSSESNSFAQSSIKRKPTKKKDSKKSEAANLLVSALQI